MESECRCPRCGVLFDCGGRAEVLCCEACEKDLELEEQYLRDHESDWLFEYFDYPDDYEEDSYV